MSHYWIEKYGFRNSEAISFVFSLQTNTYVRTHLSFYRPVKLYSKCLLVDFSTMPTYCPTVFMSANWKNEWIAFAHHTLKNSLTDQLCDDNWTITFKIGKYDDGDSICDTKFFTTWRVTTLKWLVRKTRVKKKRKWRSEREEKWPSPMVLLNGRQTTGNCAITTTITDNKTMQTKRANTQNRVREQLKCRGENWKNPPTFVARKRLRREDDASMICPFPLLSSFTHKNSSLSVVCWLIRPGYLGLCVLCNYIVWFVVTHSILSQIKPNAHTRK